MKKRLRSGGPPIGRPSSHRLSIILGVLLLIVGLFHGTDTTFDPAVECQTLADSITTREIYTQCAGYTLTAKIGQTVLFDGNDLTKDELDNFFSTYGGNLGVDFKLDGSTTIEQLDLSNVRLIQGSFIITNNKELNLITGVNRTFFTGEVLTVRGNPKLTEESISFIARQSQRVIKSEIQNPKDCLYDPNNLADLEGCEHIYKDLALEDFAQFTEPATAFYPKSISGCLTLKKTTPLADPSLDISDFLKEFISSGSQTKDCTAGSVIDKYCVKNEFQEKIKAAIESQSSITITPDRYCVYDCSPEDIFSFNQTGCKTITGKLTVAPSATDAQLKLLENVKEVHGQVVIENFADARELDFLSNLQMINSTHPTDPPLVIRNNKKAKGMNLNSLSKVLAPHNKSLLFEGNGFNCTDSDLRVLVPAMRKQSKYEVGCDGTSQQRVALNSSQTASENTKATEEDSFPVWAIVIIVILPILLIVAIVIVVVVLIRKKKKKEAAEDAEDDAANAPDFSALKAQETPEVKKLAEALLAFEFKEHKGFNAYLEFFKANINYLRSNGKDLGGGLTVDPEKPNKKVDVKKPCKTKPNKIVNHQHWDRVDISCFETTAVKLDKFLDELQNDKFVHANYMNFKDFGCKDKLIATQHPIVDKEELNDVDAVKKRNVDRFFTMIMQEEALVVINLNGWELEPVYIPRENNENMHFDMFDLKCLEKNRDYVVVQRKIEITHKKSQKKHTFMHLDVEEWPDKQVPQIGIEGYMTSVYKLIDDARGKSDGAVIVHCKAGVGRTCTLLVGYAMYLVFNRDPSYKNLYSMQNWYAHARSQRALAIQKDVQFLLLPAYLLLCADRIAFAKLKSCQNDP